MAYYIHSAASSDALTRDIRELIPAPEMRRRMSRVLRMGVSTGMEALAALPAGEQAAAIVTATGLGCLADSEKFLRNVIEQDETLLNPTPFIQSTFNTVGAQIALLTGNTGYNMTYVHGGRSFESALLDAMIQIDEAGARYVLVGAFDEATPLRDRIMGRLGAWRHAPGGEGAWFFTLSAHPHEGAPGRLETLDFLECPSEREAILARYGGGQLLWNNYGEGLSHTAPARSLWKGMKMLAEGCERVILYNDCFGEGPTVMVLSRS